VRVISWVAALAAAFTFSAIPPPAWAVGFPANAVTSDTAAGAYCESTGGKVENRVPEYGTNGSQPLVLSGHHKFCVYSSHGAHIHLFLDTLYTTLPSLAALAYYAQVQPGQCNGNPASCYCTLLGGSDQFGGTSGNGGAWVSEGKIDTDLEACIFPDLSTIDSWGLLYHSQGIIRGIDLSTVLRYQNPYGTKHNAHQERVTPF
jgi:putative hemolysin